MSEKLTVPQAISASSSLKLVDREALREHMNQIYDAIARRAFELFSEDGITGRDLDHWLKAEQELLHPLHVTIEDFPDKLSIHAEVPGFNANELEVSLEPQRLTISGKKSSRREYKDGKTVYREQCSNEIFRTLELPAEIDTSTAGANLKNGILDLTMLKARQAKANKVLVKAASAS